MLAAADSTIAAILFIDVAIVVVVARCMGAAFKKIRQPAVVGEILAGILLGPTLLGALPFGPEAGCIPGAAGGVPAWLFPCEVRPFLGVVAELGLIIFMF
ncbi:MAG TPA: cation:proton antiporter, partial [Acidimicrobiia bacterium]|nr:cation:proton antiporter [Acidimicrobiia bacterium]